MLRIQAHTARTPAYIRYRIKCSIRWGECSHREVRTLGTRMLKEHHCAVVFFLCACDYRHSEYYEFMSERLTQDGWPEKFVLIEPAKAVGRFLLGLLEPFHTTAEPYMSNHHRPEQPPVEADA